MNDSIYEISKLNVSQVVEKRSENTQIGFEQIVIGQLWTRSRLDVSFKVALIKALKAVEVHDAEHKSGPESKLDCDCESLSAFKVSKATAIQMKHSPHACRTHTHPVPGPYAAA